MKKTEKIAVGVGCCLLIFNQINTPVLAVSCPDSSLRSEADSLLECNTPEENGTTVSEVIKTIIDFVLMLAGLVCLAMIIYSAMSYMTSQGDTQKVTKATRTLAFSIAGLVIAILAYAIVNLVLNEIF